MKPPVEDPTVGDEREEEAERRVERDVDEDVGEGPDPDGQDDDGPGPPLQEVVVRESAPEAGGPSSIRPREEGSDDEDGRHEADGQVQGGGPEEGVGPVPLDAVHGVRIGEVEVRLKDVGDAGADGQGDEVEPPRRFHPEGPDEDWMEGGEG